VAKAQVSAKYRDLPESEVDDETLAHIQKKAKVEDSRSSQELSIQDVDAGSPGPFQVLTALSLAETCVPHLPEMEYATQCLKRWLYVEVGSVTP
jgi:hypothetical protein